MALEQTNDAKRSYLQSLGYTGSIDDMFRQRIDATVGRTASERDFWLSQYPTGTGTINEIKFDYFASLGFNEGGLQDRENRYWASLSP